MSICKIIYCIFFLPLIIKSQCHETVIETYFRGDKDVLIYPDNSGLFDNSDSLVGLLTWNLDPCKTHIIYSDKKKNKKLAEYLFNADTVISIHYYLNGKIKQVDKELGKSRSFIYTALYYDNGQLLYSDNPNSAERRTITHFYSNGKKKKEFILHGMCSWGQVIKWYSNGKIESIEEYSALSEETAELNNVSKKIGVWQYWDENGKLIRKKTFENDKLTKDEIQK